MIRQNIILDNFTYIVDLYKANSDLTGNLHREEFVILKTNIMINNVMHDKDIFFVKKSIIEKCIVDDVIDTDLLGEMITFPITNNSITISYSSNYQAFNGSYNETTFNMSKYGDIYRIYDEGLEKDAKILCDKIRIWFPINNSKLKSIIHISNIINDIRFHYISENIDNYERDANSEMKIGNDIYSEYIDIWIPNIEDLFKPGNCYIKEYYNFAKIKQKIIFNNSKEEYMTIYPSVYYETTSTDSVIKQFSVEAFKTFDFDSDYKIGVEINGVRTILNWDLMSCNGTFTISNYDDCRIIILHDNEKINEYNAYQYTIQYNEDNSLYYSTFLMVLPFLVNEQHTIFEGVPEKVYFNTENNLLDNILANPIIVSLFPFSNINETTKTYEASKTIENSDIFTLSKDIKMAIKFIFNDDIYNGIENYGIYMLNCKFNYNSIYNEDLQSFYLNKVKLSLYDYISNDIIDNGEYDDEIFNPKIKKCGYVIEMSTDSSFKSLIYEYVINMNIDDTHSTIIEDTNIRLNFDTKEIMWNGYPDTLLIRVKYVDKLSYTIITSNTLFITKENFKYIINYDDNRLALIDNNQDLHNQIASTKYNNLIDMAFNFIDKINCTIISKDSENENSVTNAKTNQRIVYKPIFYKVKDLQQIKLKNGITQNIGLNLSDILSKVNTFKIVINGTEYPEIARNDAFVIFKINSQNLSGTAGQYNLIDQDDQFISDGTWYIY